MVVLWRNSNSFVAIQSQEVETPMRIGGTRPIADGGASIRVANSDIPTSPVIPSTSPGISSIRVPDIDLSSPLNYGTPSSIGSIRTPRSGIRGTPMRIRPDIRVDRHLRQVNIGSDNVSLKQLNYSEWLLIYENVFFFSLVGTNW